MRELLRLWCLTLLTLYDTIYAVKNLPSIVSHCVKSVMASDVGFTPFGSRRGRERYSTAAIESDDALLGRTGLANQAIVCAEVAR
jgi:hypothetical protein